MGRKPKADKQPRGPFGSYLLELLDDGGTQKTLYEKSGVAHKTFYRLLGKKPQGRIDRRYIIQLLNGLIELNRPLKVENANILLRRAGCDPLRADEPMENEILIKLTALSKPSSALPVESISPPFMVLPLPDDFTPRTKEQEKLVGYLLERQIRKPVAITAALKGAGGFGKTAMAIAICHDDRVRTTFPDGILWVTIGDKPGNLSGKVEDWIIKLSGMKPNFTAIEAAVDHLRTLLIHKKMLLVIDDIWNAGDVKPFFQGGIDCAYLLTTRDNATLPPNTHKVNIDAMSITEATTLLGSGLGDTEAPLIIEQLKTLARRLGEWPILLKLTNGFLRQLVLEENQDLIPAISRVNLALDTHGLTAFDIDDPRSRDQAIASTIDISLEHLNRTEQELYRKLAIFPEDADIPLASVTRLWNCFGTFNHFKTEELCRKLFRMSLLLEFDSKGLTIRLHDVIRSYLRHREKEGLKDINNRFLDSYSVANWVDLPSDEPYLWDNLFYHLRESSYQTKLTQTAKDLRYLVKKTYLRSTIAVEADLQIAHTVSENDRIVTLLWRIYRQNVHLISLCANLRGIEATLYSRLQHVEILAPLCEDFESTIPRPYIYPEHQLPDLASTSSIRTILSHASQVYGCAISPDGKFVASASDDGILKVWDLATGAQFHALGGHAGGVRACAISPDGKLLASASDDRTLKVWDLATGRHLRSFEGHTRGVRSCAISPNGKYIVSGSFDRTLKVWDLTNGSLVHTLAGHVGAVRSSIISPDGKIIVSTSADRTIKIWDLTSGTLIHTLTGHLFGVWSCVFTPDGKFLVTSSGDKTLKVWDVTTNRVIRTFEGHTVGVRACAITPDAKQIVSASFDRTVKIWDLNTGAQLRSLQGHFAGARGCAVTPDGKHIISVSFDTTLRIWDMGIEEELERSIGHSSQIRGCAISPDGKYMVSASFDKTLKLWDLVTGLVIHTMAGHLAAVRGCAITPDGKSIISASDDKTVKVWDLATGRLLRSFEGHLFGVWGCGISSDNKIIVSTSSDRTIRAWELETGVLIHTLTGHTAAVSGCAITPDGRYIVSTSWDKTLKVWELKTGGLIHTLIGHTAAVNGCRVTPDGRQIISASDDKTLKIWDLVTGVELHSFTGHSSAVKGCAIDSKSKNVLSVSIDKTLKMWNIEEDICLATFMAEGPLYGCAISIDNEHIVAVGERGAYFLKVK